MKIFLDTADSLEIKKWLKSGVLDGITTNPSIMFRDGIYDLEQGIRHIANLVAPRPVSVEVTTNNPNEMLEQGRAFNKLASNIVVKIPVINESGESCLPVIAQLSSESIEVNVTAMMAFNQVMLSAKAGGRYLSIFGGRVADEGHDPATLIKSASEWLQRWGYTAEIIVGSIRGVIDMQKSAIAGAHIITVPPHILAKGLDHQYSRKTVHEFVSDGQKALEFLARDRVSPEPSREARGISDE